MSNPVASPFPASYTRHLPRALFRADQVRQLDRCAIEDHGIPGIVLMKRAGRAAFEYLLERWPDPECITVMCGAGNNAGDGYIVAALAAQRRIPVDVLWLSDPEKLTGDAFRAYQFARQEGVIVQPYAAGAQLQGVVVDGLLGTGLNGDVRPPYRDAIAHMNDSGLPILALDIPSGLSADTGLALGGAVRADATVTFIGMKQGLMTAFGPACCGELLYSDLQVPAEVLSTQSAASERLLLEQLLARLPDRSMDAHKGHFGHVMLIGGDHGYGGAVMMAAESACRMGSGLTSVATRPEHVTAMLTRRPEVMANGVSSGQELTQLLPRSSVLVVGPGLGRSAWSEQLLQAAAEANLPMVLDADALNMLADKSVLGSLKRDNWILTPHPGEAARLLDCQVADVTADRFAAVRALQNAYGGSVLLKGAGSLIACRDGGISVCDGGNPGMASGGMGDVLSGVLGGLLAQGFDQDLCLKLAVCLHASAADAEVRSSGQRGLLAMDLVKPMRQLLNGIVPSEAV